MTTRNKTITLLIFALCFFLNACGSQEEDKYPTQYPKSVAKTKQEVIFPQYPNTAVLIADGVAMIDYSNVTQGYIGARLLREQGPKVNIQIMKDEEKVDDFIITSMDYTTLPIQKGDGNYKFKIMENTDGNMYAVLMSVDVAITLVNQEQPYLYPNQVVDYDVNSQVVDLSFSLTKKDDNDLARVYTLYNYVVEHLDYDKDKAKNVTGKYVLPDLDVAINEGKGICFDYASLLAALCRVQGIPAKVITGNTSLEYHAWVEIYLEGKGWINPKYEFDKEKWTLVDPTFDSSGADYEGSYEEVKHY